MEACGIHMNAATEIVNAITAGSIPAVSINFGSAQ